MAAQDWIERIIDGIYEAALAPDLWASVLAEAGERVGASAGTVFWADGGGYGLRRAALWNVDPELVALYQRELIFVCPRMKASLAMRAGEVLDDRPLRSAGGAMGREYYALFDRLGLGRVHTLLAESRPDLRLCVNLLAPFSSEPEPETEALLRLMSPHVRRAGAMTLALGELHERADLGDALLERAAATLLLDRAGRVRRLNAPAEAILSRCDGLLLVGGVLRAVRAGDQERLRREIAAALSPSRGEEDPPGAFALVARPSGAPAWAISASRLPPSACSESALALVTVAETLPRLPVEALRHGFGLSPAEAEIAAALARGRSLEEIAVERAAALGTVRSQLKGVFTKLDVSSQAQLVARMASVLRVLAPA